MLDPARLLRLRVAAGLPPMFAHNEGFDDYPAKVIDLRKGLPLP